MRPEKVSSQLARELWQGEVAQLHGAVSVQPQEKRSAQAMRIIELAHTLASAETAVLTGDEAKAVADLKRLQAATLQMLAELERPLQRTV